MSGWRARRGSPKARAAEAAVEHAYGERGQCNRAAEERSCRAWQRHLKVIRSDAKDELVERRAGPRLHESLFPSDVAG